MKKFLLPLIFTCAISAVSVCGCNAMTDNSQDNIPPQEEEQPAPEEQPTPDEENPAEDENFSFNDEKAPIEETPIDGVSPDEEKPCPDENGERPHHDHERGKHHKGHGKIHHLRFPKKPKKPDPTHIPEQEEPNN
jgi:hypothetical protein